MHLGGLKNNTIGRRAQYTRLALAEVWAGLLAVIYPAVCPVSGLPLLPGETGVSFGGLARLAHTNWQSQPTDNPVFTLLAKQLETLTAACAIFHYEKDHLLQTVLHQMKYQGQASIAAALGVWSGQLISQSSFITGDETVVPVPLHWRRAAERGFNQSEVFGRQLAVQCGLKFVPDFVQRTRYTGSQARRSAIERRKSMENAFSIHQQASCPASIILVDDVVTTGSTLLACGQAIQARFPSVPIKVLAIAAA